MNKPNVMRALALFLCMHTAANAMKRFNTDPEYDEQPTKIAATQEKSFHHACLWEKSSEIMYRTSRQWPFEKPAKIVDYGLNNYLEKQSDDTQKQVHVISWCFTDELGTTIGSNGWYILEFKLNDNLIAVPSFYYSYKRDLTINETFYNIAIFGDPNRCLVKLLDNQSGSVTAMLTLNDTLIASGSTTGEIKIWNIVTGNASVRL